MLREGTPFAEALAGWFMTASMDVRFLKPAICPGVVGIETEQVEYNGRKIKLRATMKDGKGTALITATAVFVRLGNTKL